MDEAKKLFGIRDFSSFIISEIFCFLDIRSIFECRKTCKKCYKIISSGIFWDQKFNKTTEGSHFEGPYFEFPDPFNILEKIHQSSHFESHQDISKFLKILKNPRKLLIESIISSSSESGYPSTNLLLFNNLLWKSSPSDSSDSSDFLLLTLKEESLIFSVNFKVARLKIKEYNLPFPPVSFKVLIGSSEFNFHYESKEFQVSYSENYNTLFVLPEIVKGKCIKILLIGKKCKDVDGWLCCLRFLEVVGFDGGEDEGLKMIQESNFSGVELSPFYVERIQKIGKLNELFQVVTDYENDVLAYFYEVFRFEFQMSFNFSYTEMAANYYFKIEDDFRALNFYRGIKDPFGIVKTLIILKNFKGIQKVLKDVGENISLDVVFDIACGIKGKKFAQKVLIELSNYIG